MSEIFVDLYALEQHKDTLTNEYHATERLMEHLKKARQYDDYNQHHTYDVMIKQCDDMIACYVGMIAAIEHFQEGYYEYKQFADEVFSYERHMMENIFQ